MAVLNLSNPIFHMDDPATGGPLVGGLVYTYAAGTSTELATYSDRELTTPNTNPVVLNGYGDAKIFFNENIKVVVRSADGLTTYYTFDYVSATGGVTTTQGDFNLLLNGSFETDSNSDTLPDDWTISEFTGGAATIDNTYNNGGVYSLKFTSTGTGGGTATSNKFSIEANQFITVSWALFSSVTNVRNIVQLRWYDSADALLSTYTVYDDDTNNPTVFTKYVYPVIAPSGAASADLVLTGCSDLDVTAGSTWFDTVSVIQNERPDIETFINYETDFYYISDWTTSGSVVASKGAVSPISGVIYMNSTGADCLAYNQVEVQPTKGDLYYKTKVYLVSLSDATDDYTAFFGLNASQSVTYGSALGFRYNHGLNGGNWTCLSDDGSSATSTNSGVVVTAGTWVTLSFAVNSAGTEVKFFIDNTLVATTTTNIYTSATITPVIFIDRNAGTNSKALRADYLVIKQAVIGGR